MAEEEEFVILYTAQKTKKAKTWHDGMLKVSSAASKAVLYDDKKTRLDTLFVKAADVLPGEQIESDRYLILIEEKRSQDDKTSSSSHVHAVTSSTCVGRPVSGRSVLTAPGPGLRRGKRKGFVPPRICKQVEADQASADIPSVSAMQGSTSGVIPLQGMTTYKASLMNLYSRNSPDQTSFGVPNAGSQDRSDINLNPRNSPALDQTSLRVPNAGSLNRSEVFPQNRALGNRSDTFGNAGRTDQRGPGLSSASAAPAASQGTGLEDSDVSPQLTSFMSMLHSRGGSRERSPSGQERKRLKCNPWRTFGSRSNSDSQGSQTSEESSQEQNKPKTFTTNHLASKTENDKCKGTEMIRTDGNLNSVSLGSSSHIDHSANKSETNIAASTKRSTSQIMALLKQKAVPNNCENFKSEDMTSNHSLQKSNVTEEVTHNNNSSDFRMQEADDGFPDIPGTENLTDSNMIKSNDMVPASDSHECLDENIDNANKEECAINPFELSDATFDINFSPLSHVSSSSDEDEQMDLKDQDSLAGATTEGRPHETPAVAQGESPRREPGVGQKMTDDNLHATVGCVNPPAAPVIEELKSPAGIKLDARQALADDNQHYASERATSEYSKEGDVSGKQGKAHQEMTEDSRRCVAADVTDCSPLYEDPVEQSLSGTEQYATPATLGDIPQWTSQGATDVIPEEAAPVELTEECSGMGEEAGQTLVQSAITAVEKEDRLLNISTWGDAGCIDNGLIQLIETGSKSDLIPDNMKMLQNTQELTVSMNIKDDKPENIDRHESSFTYDGCCDGNHPETSRSIPLAGGHCSTPTDMMGSTKSYQTETVEQTRSHLSVHTSPEIPHSINPLSNLQFSPDSFDLNSSLSQFSQSGFLGKLNAASAVSDRNEKLSSPSLISPSYSAFDDNHSKQSGFHKECLPLQVNKQPEETGDDFQSKSSLSVEADRHNSHECKDPQNILNSSNVQQGGRISCQDGVTNTPDDHSEPLPTSQPSIEDTHCAEIPQREHRQSKKYLHQFKPESSNDTSQEKGALCSISKPEFDSIADLNLKQLINNQNTLSEQDSVGEIFSSPSIKHDIENRFPSSSESVISTVLCGDADQSSLVNESRQVMSVDSDKSFPMPDTPEIPTSGSQTSQDTMLDDPQEISNHSSDESPLSSNHRFQRTLTETVSSTQPQYLTSDSMISMRGRFSLKVSSQDQEPSVLQADGQMLKCIPSAANGHLRLNPGNSDGHHKQRHDLAIPDGSPILRQHYGIPDGHSFLRQSDSSVQRHEETVAEDATSQLSRRQVDTQDPHQHHDVRCQISRKLEGYSVKGMVSSGVVRRDDPLRSTYMQNLPEDPLGCPSITGVGSTRPYGRTGTVTQIQLQAAIQKLSSDCKQTDSQTSPELGDLLSSQFPLYHNKHDSSPEQFKLRKGLMGQFPLMKRNDFQRDLVTSPVPLHASGRVFGATSNVRWLVHDSQSSTSTAEPQPGLGHVPNISSLLKSEPQPGHVPQLKSDLLQKLPFDTLSPAETDEEFYIDWNQGKPKMVSRPYDMAGGSNKDTQNVPQSMRGSTPPSSTDSSPINNHVVPDLDGDLRKAALCPGLEETVDTTQSDVMHKVPFVSQQKRKAIKTNPSTDGKQVEGYDTYLESSGDSETGDSETGGTLTREESNGRVTGSTGTVDQLHGRSCMGQQQIRYCGEGFKRLNDVGESQQKKSNVSEKKIFVSHGAAMPDQEAPSHVLRRPTVDSDLYGVSDDRSGEGVYRYRGSAGWQQRQQGQIWDEEEKKVKMKTSRWGRYLNMEDVGNSGQAPKSHNMASSSDPSGNTASDQRYRLQSYDRGVTSVKKQSDDTLYKVLDSNCDNFFGGGINCVPNSVKQQSNYSSCAVEDVDGGGVRTPSQYEDEFDDSFDEDCLKEDKAMLSVEETYKPKYTTQTENVQPSLHRGSKYVRNIDSSLSPDLFMTQEQGRDSMSTKFTKSMCANSGGNTHLQTTRKVGLGKFRNPMTSFSSSTLKGSQRNLCGELQFPSHSEAEANVTPSRQVVIPASFQNLHTYKQVITAALREHLNIMLFEVSKIYHSALGKVDVTQFSRDGGTGKLPNKSTASSNPPCKCGIPSKLVQVRKEGPNKGRFFYACEAPRNQQCKFFQWMDQPSSTGGGKTASAAGVTRATLGSADSITAYIRGHSVTFYCQCLYLHKYRDNYNKHRKGIPAWVRQRQEEGRKKSMFIKLSKKDASSYYAKDDLWVVSQSLLFDPGRTFVARSVYFGPNSGNEVEIEPISGFSPSNWNNNCECHAILTGNASTELACLANLEEHVQLSCLPILPYILERVEDNQRQRLAAHSHTKLCVPGHFIMNLAEDYLSRFQLNRDQSEALMRVAAMMNKDVTSSEPVLLIHGVFGAGKSFLLSVIIRFLVDVFDKNDSYSPDVPYPWKLLISSTTNVAVDRVLMGLLDLGFEDFVRVGSVKKIAKPVLPYSVHASGSDSQELKDLQEMLRSDIPPGDKQLVRKSIEKHRLGENKKKLGGVRVVGVTCAACSFNCLHNMRFPFVVLDECSQMTEPSSLLPIARFSCEKLVLVGDPKQLDPTIQGSEAAHSDGLEQTLFDRLMKLDYSPVMLRTQYRCHPRISGIANTLFYNGQLCDGVTEDCRQPLSPVFPTLCFYDEAGGQEMTDGSGSYYNENEARLVVLLIHALVMVGVEAGSIGVITLYKAQMYKIITSLHTDNPAVNKELKSVQVSTVDAFQGAEKDVIILSCVRSNNIGFIDSDKRANVALTRARHHLLIVGHQKNLSRNKLWSRVIQLCRAHPGGLQASSTASVELAALVEERQSQTLTGSSQEGQGKDSMGQGKKKRSRKRKRGKEEEDSPPMSLSGQSMDSSGRSVEILTPPDVPVDENNMAGAEAADVGQKMLLTEDCVLSECSVNTLSKECDKYKRPRRSHLLDPDVFLDLDDKNNSSDEDLPSYM